MFDNQENLLKALRLGETTFLEFKEVRFAGRQVKGPSRTSMADELAALANARGGVLVLGIEDSTREILGIPLDRLDDVMDFVREVCADSIDPPLAPVIDRLWLPSAVDEERAVIKIDVGRSVFVHRSPGGYLHRVGDAKRIMSSEYLARLLQQRSQSGIIRFDEQALPHAHLEDLVPALWDRFRTARTANERNVLLQKLRMARPDDHGALRPTVAGVLMASDDPRRWLPSAFIQAVAYRGNRILPQDSDRLYQLDAADITGSLDAQIEDACRFVARNMKIAAYKIQGRVDIPQFDMTAVFEAVVNAVAHRDYSIYGSKVRLRLFEDRLELYSPGGLPNTMTVESLEHVQSTRNEALTSLLAKCKIPHRIPWLNTDRKTLMDRRGEGVRIILENSARLSGRPPEFRLFDDEQLLLTIYSAVARPSETVSPS